MVEWTTWLGLYAFWHFLDQTPLLLPWVWASLYLRLLLCSSGNTPAVGTGCQLLTTRLTMRPLCSRSHLLNLDPYCCATCWSLSPGLELSPEGSRISILPLRLLHSPNVPCPQWKGVQGYADTPSSQLGWGGQKPCDVSVSRDEKGSQVWSDLRPGGASSLASSSSSLSLPSSLFFPLHMTVLRTKNTNSNRTLNLNLKEIIM